MAEDEDVGLPDPAAEDDWLWNRFEPDEESDEAPEEAEEESQEAPDAPDDGRERAGEGEDDAAATADESEAGEGSHPDEGDGPTGASLPAAGGGEPAPATPPPPAGRDVASLQPLYRARPREFYLLWLLAVLTYGVGDSLTTGLALLDTTVRETNPVVALVVGEANIAGFFALKLALFVLLIAISAKGAIDRDSVAYYGPPVFAILLGTALTLWNLASIGLL